MPQGANPSFYGVMLKHMNRWKKTIKCIESLSPDKMEEVKSKAAEWHTCAAGANLCDILGISPDELLKSLDAWTKDKGRITCRGTALHDINKLDLLDSCDRTLVNLGYEFSEAIYDEDQENAEHTFIFIKDHAPAPALLTNIKAYMQA